jgi:plastocyanin
VLRGAGALGTLGSVAGCVSTDDGPESGPTGDTSTATATSTASATPTPTASPTPVAMVTPSADPVVRIADQSFVPRYLRVDPGTEVTWDNEGSGFHAVESAVFNPDVATEWSFYSADMPTGRRVGHTFEEAGIYEYSCTVHGQTEMCGVVLVGTGRYPASLPCE